MPDQHRPWNRVVLETSLKPYGRAGLGRMDEVSEAVVKTWEKLIQRSAQIGILLWVGDGTEILVWNGDLAQRLEWGRYVGFCNIAARAEPYFPGWFDNRPPEDFQPDPPEMTYGDLKRIISTLRGAARRLLDREIAVGMTYDPTPEFVDSPFKYEEHLEVLWDHPLGRRRQAQRFLSHQGVFHEDGRRFAAFPQGIPAGTSVGTFLGRQARQFGEALGYDYLWLSNGFGYSHYAWCLNGEVLETDGAWHTDRAADQRHKLIRFWRDFRREVPRLPLEVRGTNFTVGMDLSTDAASHLDIQEHGDLTVEPPNLPVLHAELLAIDVVTFMTRMAGAPGDRIIYRTYLNDPWHENNPWYTIYNREPFETYTCMASGRLGADGIVRGPTDLHILSIDTERGELPPDEANEVVPHYLRAARERADAAGPFVWVYPFDEYHEVLHSRPHLLPHVFFGDHYIWKSVEGGLPLNTVCRARDFRELVTTGQCPDAIFIAPAPLGRQEYADRLLEHVRTGGKAILYGSLTECHSEILDAFRVRIAEEELEGDFLLESRLIPDRFHDESDPSRLPLRHRAESCGGGLREIGNQGVLIAARQGAETRAYCTVASDDRWNGGRLAWIRGTVPYGLPREPPFIRTQEDDPAEVRSPRELLRGLLSEFGWRLVQERPDRRSEPTRLFIKRYDGAWYFVGAKADTRSHVLISTPDGAPVFTEYDTPITESTAREDFGKSIYNEVRFFVRMEQGVCRARCIPHGLKLSRAFSLSGCRDATVTIYPPPDAVKSGRVLILRNELDDYQPGGDPIPQVRSEFDDQRGCVVVKNHTGPLYVKW